MHLPDGFLSTPVWVASDIAAVAVVGYAARKVQEEMDERKLPLLGITAAFVFAAQTLNFPIPVCTAGHVMCGLLSDIVVGPRACVFVMSVVLMLQALLFGDGGVLALGANILNMAFIGTWLSYHLYRWLAKYLGESIAMAIGAWLSLVLGATSCALQ